ncbi:MAG TPA: hypothetical protein VGE10_07165 [Zeimonas sp.]
MVERAGTGRAPTELEREFDVSAASIRNWIRQAALADRAPAVNALSIAEREELAYLRRENRRLQMGRDILAKATAWFANRGEETSTPSSNS